MPFYNRDTDVYNFVAAPFLEAKGFAAYAKGYFRAANLVCESMLRGKHVHDCECYPVWFLYRHCLELYLKHLAVSPAFVVGLRGREEIVRKFQKTHSMNALAHAAASMLKSLFPAELELHQWFRDMVLPVCRDLDEADPCARAFLYPVKSDGAPHFAETFSANVLSIHDAMNEIVPTLDAIDITTQLDPEQLHQVYEALES